MFLLRAKTSKQTNKQRSITRTEALPGTPYLTGCKRVSVGEKTQQLTQPETTTNNRANRGSARRPGPGARRLLRGARAHTTHDAPVSHLVRASNVRGLLGIMS